MKANPAPFSNTGGGALAKEDVNYAAQQKGTTPAAE
jgi:hypothetical protein